MEQQQPSSPTAASTAKDVHVTSEETKLSDAAVLAYLREKGMTEAASALEQRLSTANTSEPMDTETTTSKNDESDTAGAAAAVVEETIEQQEEAIAASNSNWCIQDAPGVAELNISPEKVEEAKNCVESFIALQSKVLALPDEGCARENAVGTTNDDDGLYFPPSEKPELLSITFSLLVHTYCELLEVGMESTARTVREAFSGVYDAVYSEQCQALATCTTLRDMRRINEQIRRQRKVTESIHLYVPSLHDTERYVASARDKSKDPKTMEALSKMNKLRRHCNELSKEALKLELQHDVTFVKKARRYPCVLNISKSSYSLLLALMDEPMRKLLHSKCRICPETRAPMRYIPACCFDESPTTTTTSSKLPTSEPDAACNEREIRWAAPSLVPRSGKNTPLPYPHYHLEADYETVDAARKGRARVEFNRALILNGFRRLEALERKRELDFLSMEAKKRIKTNGLVRPLTNALEPSILLTTLTASTPPTTNPEAAALLSPADLSSRWEEAGVHITCAKLLAVDGQKVAAGCSDSAIRIWTAGGATAEPTQTLLGHRDGLPIFDVDWGRDGRSVLSAGGDGVIRLWDTMAVGPHGELATSPYAKPKQPALADGLVPGSIPDDPPYRNGAEIARFVGHSPGTAVWSVAFAPSGYYFCSGGGDYTARIWATDCPTFVRLLAGHTAPNVNCVAWHPNCNYVLTGSDDRTARLWDVHTGKTVRYMSGFHGPVDTAEISPSGQFAALSDRYGIVYLWDIATGKKVTEFRSGTSTSNPSMVHTVRFSHCGAALATAGDDGVIRLWDVRPPATHERPAITHPHQQFPTRQTVVMDVSFTKRNVLLAAGVFRSPIPAGDAL